MTEPHPEQNPYLDEATRTLLRVIELENLVGILREKQAKEAEERQSLAGRINILETAREQQIKLNAVFERKSDKEIEKHISFWDRFK